MNTTAQHTIKTVKRSCDPKKTTVYVTLRHTLFGHNKARLISIGHKYLRVMLADGHIFTQLPEDIIDIIR